VSLAQLGKPDYDAKVRQAVYEIAGNLIAAVKEAKEPLPSLIDMISFRVKRTVIDVTREQVSRFRNELVNAGLMWAITKTAN